ncbi:MAG: hypothetical protein JSR91_04195 [Proteobacteria bacterium]|nr:hypothetical protein [Pseudomonadota bacterium]
MSDEEAYWMKEHAGIDLPALYPAGQPPNAASWPGTPSRPRPRRAARRAPASFLAFGAGLLTPGMLIPGMLMPRIS